MISENYLLVELFRIIQDLVDFLDYLRPLGSVQISVVLLHSHVYTPRHHHLSILDDGSFGRLIEGD